jgi:hypothetical protein
MSLDLSAVLVNTRNMVTKVEVQPSHTDGDVFDVCHIQKQLL